VRVKPRETRARNGRYRVAERGGYWVANAVGYWVANAAGSDAWVCPSGKRMMRRQW
jgi:hypothetical protein